MPKNIYKVHLLNKKGDLDKILVFGATDDSEIFSDTQNAYYKLHDIKIIFLDKWIHKDDSIRTIKKKIFQELSSELKTLDEIYLFVSSEISIDMDVIYQDITYNDTEPMKSDVFLQFAVNLNSSADLTPFNDTGKTISYKEWKNLKKSGMHEIFIPLGMKFQESRDLLFSANPYTIHIGGVDVINHFEQSNKNPILTFDNTLLLNYTNSTELIVCLAKDVFDYATEKGIDQDFMCSMYYPFLYQRDIKNVDTLDSMNPDKVTMPTEYYQTIDTFYKIYRGKTVELPYKYRGISAFSITLESTDYKHKIPLDILFKNMHSTIDMPIIKYNPGKRHEKLYRLYSTQISASGKKIPVLSEIQINQLRQRMGKGNQLSIYVSHTDFFIHINENSTIQIIGDLKTPVDADALETMITQSINPIISQLNTYLESAGYELPVFRNFSSLNSALFNYTLSLPITYKIDLKKQVSYISTTFDVISTDIKTGADLRFKRVENFRKMDAQSALITEVYKQTANERDVIRSLMDNYKMTEEEAILRFGKYSVEHESLNGNYIENPGFVTSIKIQHLDIQVQVSKISFIEYIDVLQVYLDTILRFSQNPASITNISEEELNKFTKTKGVDAEKDIVNNIVYAAIAPVATKKSRFLQFDQEEAEPEDEDADADIIGINEAETEYNPNVLRFDDEYEYEEEVEEEEEGDSEQIYRGGAPGKEKEKEEKYQADIDGMSIANPTPFFKRMHELDPELFITDSKTGYPTYGTVCQAAAKRQPVILTDEEKAQIDKTSPGLYSHALHYGSDPQHKYWYICPRYWCLKTNMPISEEDVKAGKCGAIIPKGKTEVPPGAYVYEFSTNDHYDEKGKYIYHTPGFHKKKQFHPKELGLPCCFKNAWNSEDQKKRRAMFNYQENDDAAGADNTPLKATKAKTQNKGQIELAKNTSYIIGPVTDVDQYRWGFLPLSVQLFFGIDNQSVTDPQNPSIIRSNEPCLLRYGVEYSKNKSFIACMAHFYAYKHDLKSTPTIEEMINVLLEAVTLDSFLKYHNGNLATIFRPQKIDLSVIDIDNYSNTEFYKTIDLGNESQMDYLEDTIASYENFIQFLRDPMSIIDHTYLWDMMCNRNDKLMRDGFNMIILELPEDDIREKLNVLCPTNSIAQFEINKETIILLKKGEIYEPIHLYEQHDSVINSARNVVYALKRGEIVSKEVGSKGVVMNISTKAVSYKLKQTDVKHSEFVFKKAFLEHSSVKMIQDVLKMIQRATQKYCPTQPGMPRVYKFKQNLNAIEIIRVLKNHGYRVERQVLNYRNKVIGIQTNTQDDQNLLFVPCFPSSQINDLKTIYMDTDELWLDYIHTRDRLIGVSLKTKGEILCKPVVKVVEDGIVVGFLTETNQFIQIMPPQENLDLDDIEQVHHSSYTNYTDKTLALETAEEATRKETVHKINLETRFYNTFRNLIRDLLNRYENHKAKQQIREWIEDAGMLDRKKREEIESVLRELTKDIASFQEFDKSILDNLDEIVPCKCDGSSPSPKYCAVKEDESGDITFCQTIFPAKHLLSGHDNIRIYYGRVADELLRYKRIQLFMLHPKAYLNISNIEYHMNEDEIFILESLLNKEYFSDMTPYNINRYIRNIEYDTAIPIFYSGKSQKYSNDISLEEQRQLRDTASITETTTTGNFIADCIHINNPNVIGNTKVGSWRSYFPSSCRELEFNNSVTCSFIPIIYILQDLYKNTGLSVQNVKTTLWKAYKQVLDSDDSMRDKIYSNILSLLRKQKKHFLMDLVINKKTSLESAIMSDAYYITDLDWWVLCSAISLPVVLFSSTTLKTFGKMNWLLMGRKGTANEKMYFVRSPAMKEGLEGKNKPPAYGLVLPAISFVDMKNDMFLNAERGDSNYSDNIRSLSEFLKTTQFLMKEARA